MPTAFVATAGHSWQAVACGGSSTGLKGMNVAAKTLAGAMMDYLTSPQVLAEAKAGLVRRRGPDFKYEAMVGDCAPPLNYRD